jgi:hypothetical protein
MGLSRAGAHLLLQQSMELKYCLAYAAFVCVRKGRGESAPSHTNERDKTMTNAAITIEQDEETFLVGEISDEAIEAAAGRVADVGATPTLAFCSGLDTCPA